MSAKKPTVKKPAVKKPAVKAPTPTPNVDDIPSFTAVSLTRVPGGMWAVLTFTIDGDRVVNIESSEPNMRAIAIEELKIQTVNQFLAADE